MLCRKELQRGRILIVLGQTGMGDAVESLPVFELIREYWPDVHLAAGYFREKQRPILETSPYVGETVRLCGGVRYAWSSMAGLLVNRTAMQGFDTVLFLYKKEAIAWPIRLAATMAGTRILYKHGYRYRDERRNTYSDFPEHVFFQIVAANLLLQLPLTRLRRPQVALSEEDRQFADRFLSQHGLGHRPTVIINRQSGDGHPDWGIEKYARAANALADWGADVVVNGGGEHWVEHWRVSHQLSERVILLERPSPGELAAVMARCDLYLGAGHGAASLAMALGTPMIALVGPGEHGDPNQERIGPVWWPRDPKFKVLSKTDWCHANMGAACQCRYEDWKRENRWRRPKRVLKHMGVWEVWKKARRKVREFIVSSAAQGGCREPHAPPCLEAITVEEVVAAAKEQLAARMQTPVQARAWV